MSSLTAKAHTQCMYNSYTIYANHLMALQIVCTWPHLSLICLVCEGITEKTDCALWQLELHWFCAKVVWVAVQTLSHNNTLLLPHHCSLLQKPAYRTPWVFFPTTILTCYLLFNLPQWLVTLAFYCTISVEIFMVTIFRGLNFWRDKFSRVSIAHRNYCC